MHLLILIAINSLKHGVMFQLNEVTLSGSKTGLLKSRLDGEQAFFKMRDLRQEKRCYTPNPLVFFELGLLD